MVHDLLGKSFSDTENSLGGGEWTVGAFSVGSYPRKDGTKKYGSHVALEQGNTRLYLPMETDGDAADLYRRVVGSESEDFVGLSRSAAYEEALRKR